MGVTSSSSFNAEVGKKLSLPRAIHKSNWTDSIECVNFVLQHILDPSISRNALHCADPLDPLPDILGLRDRKDKSQNHLDNQHALDLWKIRLSAGIKPGSLVLSDSMIKQLQQTEFAEAFYVRDFELRLGIYKLSAKAKSKEMNDSLKLAVPPPFGGAAVSSRNTPTLHLFFPLLEGGAALLDIFPALLPTIRFRVERDRLINSVETMLRQFQRLPSMALYTSWSPTPILPEVAISIPIKEKHISSSIGNPLLLLDTTNRSWTVSSGNRWVIISLPNIANVSSVEFKWKDKEHDTINLRTPKKTTISVRVAQGKEFEEVVSLDVSKFLKASNTTWNRVPIDRDNVLALLIQFEGASSDALEISLNRIIVNSWDSDQKYISLLDSSKSLMNTIKHIANAKFLRCDCLVALCSIVKSVGSLQLTLDLCHLLSARSDLLDDEVAVRSVHELITAVRQRVSERIDVVEQETAGCGSQIILAEFDPEDITGEIKLTEGNTVCSNNSGAYYSHAVVGVDMEVGIWKFEFKMTVESDNDETTCLGVAIPGLKDSCYENNKDMWMVQCYTGCCYHSGQKKTITTIHQKDTIVFYLDVANSTLSLTLNGNDLGVLFSDVDRCVRPCVSFYSYNKSTKIVSVERIDAKPQVSQSFIRSSIENGIPEVLSLKSPLSTLNHVLSACADLSRVESALGASKGSQLLDLNAGFCLQPESCVFDALFEFCRVIAARLGLEDSKLPNLAAKNDAVEILQDDPSRVASPNRPQLSSQASMDSNVAAQSPGDPSFTGIFESLDMFGGITSSSASKDDLVTSLKSVLTLIQGNIQRLIDMNIDVSKIGVSLAFQDKDVSSSSKTFSNSLSCISSLLMLFCENENDLLPDSICVLAADILTSGSRFFLPSLKPRLELTMELFRLATLSANVSNVKAKLAIQLLAQLSNYSSVLEIIDLYTTEKEYRSKIVKMVCKVTESLSNYSILKFLPSMNDDQAVESFTASAAFRQNATLFVDRLFWALNLIICDDSNSSDGWQKRSLFLSSLDCNLPKDSNEAAKCIARRIMHWRTSTKRLLFKLLSQIYIEASRICVTAKSAVVSKFLSSKEVSSILSDSIITVMALPSLYGIVMRSQDIEMASLILPQVCRLLEVTTSLCQESDTCKDTSNQLKKMLPSMSPYALPLARSTRSRKVVCGFTPHSASEFVLSEGDMLCHSNNWNNTLAYVNFPIIKGEAIWEFLYVKDSNGDEGCLFGACIIPVTDTYFGSSPQMMTIRALCGDIWDKCKSTVANEKLKVHPNDTIRFRYIVNLGTISASINGSEEIDVFFNVQGNVCPMIATWKPDIEVRLVKFTVSDEVDSCQQTESNHIDPIQLVCGETVAWELKNAECEVLCLKDKAILTANAIDGGVSARDARRKASPVSRTDTTLPIPEEFSAVRSAQLEQKEADIEKTVTSIATKPPSQIVNQHEFVTCRVAESVTFGDHCWLLNTENDVQKLPVAVGVCLTSPAVDLPLGSREGQISWQFWRNVIVINGSREIDVEPILPAAKINEGKAVISVRLSRSCHTLSFYFSGEFCGVSIGPDGSQCSIIDNAIAEWSGKPIYLAVSVVQTPNPNPKKSETPSVAAVTSTELNVAANEDSVSIPDETSDTDESSSTDSSESEEAPSSSDKTLTIVPPLKQSVKVESCGTYSTLEFPVEMHLERSCASVIGRLACSLVSGPPISTEEKQMDSWLSSPLIVNGLDQYLMDSNVASSMPFLRNVAATELKLDWATTRSQSLVCRDLLPFDDFPFDSHQSVTSLLKKADSDRKTPRRPLGVDGSVGQLQISMLQASNLKNVNTFSTQSPYAVFRLEIDGLEVSSFTSIEAEGGGCDPKWSTGPQVLSYSISKKLEGSKAESFGRSGSMPQEQLKQFSMSDVVSSFAKKEVSTSVHSIVVRIEVFTRSKMSKDGKVIGTGFMDLSTVASLQDVDESSSSSSSTVSVPLLPQGQFNFEAKRLEEVVLSKGPASDTTIELRLAPVSKMSKISLLGTDLEDFSALTNEDSREDELSAFVESVLASSASSLQGPSQNMMNWLESLSTEIGSMRTLMTKGGSYSFPRCEIPFILALVKHSGIAMELMHAVRDISAAIEPAPPSSDMKLLWNRIYQLRMLLRKERQKFRNLDVEASCAIVAQKEESSLLVWKSVSQQPSVSVAPDTDAPSTESVELEASASEQPEEKKESTANSVSKTDQSEMQVQRVGVNWLESRIAVEINIPTSKLSADIATNSRIKFGDTLFVVYCASASMIPCDSSNSVTGLLEFEIPVLYDLRTIMSTSMCVYLCTSFSESKHDNERENKGKKLPNKPAASEYNSWTALEMPSKDEVLENAGVAKSVSSSAISALSDDELINTEVIGLANKCESKSSKSSGENNKSNVDSFDGLVDRIIEHCMMLICLQPASLVNDSERAHTEKLVQLTEDLSMNSGDLPILIRARSDGNRELWKGAVEVLKLQQESTESATSVGPDHAVSPVLSNVEASLQSCYAFVISSHSRKSSQSRDADLISPKSLLKCLFHRIYRAQCRIYGFQSLQTMIESPIACNSMSILHFLLFLRKAMLFTHSVTDKIVTTAHSSCTHYLSGLEGCPKPLKVLVQKSYSRIVHAFLGALRLIGNSSDSASLSVMSRMLESIFVDFSSRDVLWLNSARIVDFLRSMFGFKSLIEAAEPLGNALCDTCFDSFSDCVSVLEDHSGSAKLSDLSEALKNQSLSNVRVSSMLINFLGSCSKSEAEKIFSLVGLNADSSLSELCRSCTVAQAQMLHINSTRKSDICYSEKSFQQEEKSDQEKNEMNKKELAILEALKAANSPMISTESGQVSSSIKTNISLTELEHASSCANGCFMSLEYDFDAGPEKTGNYYELEVLAAGTSCAIGIGLAISSYSIDGQMPGWAVGSYGYHGDDGILYRYDHERNSKATWAKGDIVGMGIDFPGKTIFVTRNGEYLGTVFSDVTEAKLKPFIGLAYSGEKARINFGWHEFRYQGSEVIVNPNALKARESLHKMKSDSSKKKKEHSVPSVVAESLSEGIQEAKTQASVDPAQLHDRIDYAMKLTKELGIGRQKAKFGLSALRFLCHRLVQAEKDASADGAELESKDLDDLPDLSTMKVSRQVSVFGTPNNLLSSARVQLLSDIVNVVIGEISKGVSLSSNNHWPLDSSEVDDHLYEFMVIACQISGTSVFMTEAATSSAFIRDLLQLIVRGSPRLQRCAAQLTKTIVGSASINILNQAANGMSNSDSDASHEFKRAGSFFELIFGLIVDFFEVDTVDSVVSLQRLLQGQVGCGFGTVMLSLLSNLVSIVNEMCKIVDYRQHLVVAIENTFKNIFIGVSRLKLIEALSCIICICPLPFFSIGENVSDKVGHKGVIASFRTSDWNDTCGVIYEDNGNGPVENVNLSNLSPCFPNVDIVSRLDPRQIERLFIATSGILGNLLENSISSPCSHLLIVVCLRMLETLISLPANQFLLKYVSADLFHSILSHADSPCTNIVSKFSDSEINRVWSDIYCRSVELNALGVSCSLPKCCRIEFSKTDKKPSSSVLDNVAQDAAINASETKSIDSDNDSLGDIPLVLPVAPRLVSQTSEYHIYDLFRERALSLHAAQSVESTSDEAERNTLSAVSEIPLLIEKSSVDEDSKSSSHIGQSSDTLVFQVASSSVSELSGSVSDKSAAILLDSNELSARYSVPLEVSLVALIHFSGNKSKASTWLEDCNESKNVEESKSDPLLLSHSVLSHSNGLTRYCDTLSGVAMNYESLFEEGKAATSNSVEKSEAEFANIFYKGKFDRDIVKLETGDISLLEVGRYLSKFPTDDVLLKDDKLTSFLKEIFENRQKSKENIGKPLITDSLCPGMILVEQIDPVIGKSHDKDENFAAGPTRNGTFTFTSSICLDSGVSLSGQIAVLSFDAESRTVVPRLVDASKLSIVRRIHDSPVNSLADMLQSIEKSMITLYSRRIATKLVSSGFSDFKLDKKDLLRLARLTYSNASSLTDKNASSSFLSLLKSQSSNMDTSLALCNEICRGLSQLSDPSTYSVVTKIESVMNGEDQTFNVESIHPLPDAAADVWYHVSLPKTWTGARLITDERCSTYGPGGKVSIYNSEESMKSKTAFSVMFGMPQPTNEKRFRTVFCHNAHDIYINFKSEENFCKVPVTMSRVTTTIDEETGKKNLVSTDGNGCIVLSNKRGAIAGTYSFHGTGEDDTLAGLFDDEGSASDEKEEKVAADTTKIGDQNYLTGSRFLEECKFFVSSVFISSGCYYFEVTLNTVGSSGGDVVGCIGWTTDSALKDFDKISGAGCCFGSVGILSNGMILANGQAVNADSPLSLSDSCIVGCLLDLNASMALFCVDGDWNGCSSVPVDFLKDCSVFPTVSLSQQCTWTANMGGRTFAHPIKVDHALYRTFEAILSASIPCVPKERWGFRFTIESYSGLETCVCRKLKRLVSFVLDSQTYCVWDADPSSFDTKLYAPVNTIITAGNRAPPGVLLFPLLQIAKPIKSERICEFDQMVVHRLIAPEGYVSLGDVVLDSSKDPLSYACIPVSSASHASVGDRVCEISSASGKFSLWNVRNGAGSVIAFSGKYRQVSPMDMDSLDGSKSLESCVDRSSAIPRSFGLYFDPSILIMGDDINERYGESIPSMSWVRFVLDAMISDESGVLKRRVCETDVIMTLCSYSLSTTSQDPLAMFDSVIKIVNLLSEGFVPVTPQHLVALRNLCKNLIEAWTGFFQSTSLFSSLDKKASNAMSSPPEACMSMLDVAVQILSLDVAGHKSNTCNAMTESKSCDGFCPSDKTDECCDLKLWDDFLITFSGQLLLDAVVSTPICVAFKNSSSDASLMDCIEELVSKNYGFGCGSSASMTANNWLRTVMDIMKHISVGSKLSPPLALRLWQDHYSCSQHFETTHPMTEKLESVIICLEGSDTISFVFDSRCELAEGMYLVARPLFDLHDDIDVSSPSDSDVIIFTENAACKTTIVSGDRLCIFIRRSVKKDKKEKKSKTTKLESNLSTAPISDDSKIENVEDDLEPLVVETSAIALQSPVWGISLVARGNGPSACLARKKWLPHITSRSLKSFCWTDSGDETVKKCVLFEGELSIPFASSIVLSLIVKQTGTLADSVVCVKLFVKKELEYIENVTGEIASNRALCKVELHFKDKKLQEILSGSHECADSDLSIRACIQVTPKMDVGHKLVQKLFNRCVLSKSGKPRSWIGDTCGSCITPAGIVDAMSEWSRSMDSCLLDYINTLGSGDPFPSNDSCGKFVVPKSQLKYDMGRVSHCSLFSVQTRCLLFDWFNTIVVRLLPTFDILHPKTNSIGSLLLSNSAYLFMQSKTPLLDAALGNTQGSSSSLDITLSNLDAVGSRELGQVDISTSKCCFVQAFNQLKDASGKDLRVVYGGDRVFGIGFDEESGIDAGGVFREGIVRIVEDLCSPYLDLLILCPNGQHHVSSNMDKYVPNPKHTGPLGLQMFELVGKLMGCSLRAKLCLAFEFPSIVWKKLSGEVPNADDLQAMDDITFKILSNLRNCEENGICDEESFLAKYGNKLKFVFSGSDGVENELKPGGRQQSVTFSNRLEYCDLVVSTRLHEFDQQLDAVIVGFSKIVPLRIVRLFSWKQIEISVCGTPVVDVELWKRHSSNSGLPDDVYKRFWKVMESLTSAEQSLFIRFAWGRSRLPPESAFHNDMSLDDAGTPNKLPVAHTCFFSIEMPRYETDEDMRHALLTVIHFGAVGILNG